MHNQRAGLRVVLHCSMDTAAEYMATSASTIYTVSQVTGVCAGATDAELSAMAPGIAL